MGEQLNVKVSSLKLKKMMLTALLAVGFIAPASAEEARSPVGKLMDPNGAVEYSRDGEKWRPVTRAKYLFSGYHIRTGADGSGNFINQESGLAQSLSANVAAMVGDTGWKFLRVRFRILLAAMLGSWMVLPINSPQPSAIPRCAVL